MPNHHTTPPHPVISPGQRNFLDSKAIGDALTENTTQQNKSDYHTYFELDDKSLKNYTIQRNNEHYDFIPIPYKDYDYATAPGKPGCTRGGNHGDLSDNTYNWQPVESTDYANPSTEQGSLDYGVVNIKVYHCRPEYV